MLIISSFIIRNNRTIIKYKSIIIGAMTVLEKMTTMKFDHLTKKEERSYDTCNVEWERFGIWVCKLHSVMDFHLDTDQSHMLNANRKRLNWIALNAYVD